MSPRPYCLALLLATGAAQADTPIDQTRPLSAEGLVSIDNLKGRIEVRTWDRPEVRITGTLGEGVEKLLVEGDSDHLRIEVDYPENGGGWFGWGGGGGKARPSDLVVTLPARASVSVDSVSAEVDIAGVGGRRLSVDTVSGNVLARGVRVGEARFDNVSGDVDAELDSDDVSVDSVSGDIRLAGRLGGSLQLDTVSGDATVVAGRVQELALASVSGDGDVRAGLLPGGSLRAESVSGGLRVALPRATSARLRVETFSGSISSPVGTVHSEEFGPGKSLEARMGGGEGDIQLESFSGSVRITYSDN